MTAPDSRNRMLVLIACMGVMFMAAVEGTIVATAMPTVASALGGYALFGWTFAAYLLAQSTSIPIYGRLADLFGRKPMFFAGAGIFIVGSAICGAAPTMLVLILGRAVQGVGAGGIVPVAQTIIGDIFTPAERARIQGYLSSMWGISAIIGPLLGAFMVERLSWPMIFWFNIPVALVVIGMIAVLFKEQRHRAEHSIDVVGAVLMIIGVGALMLALMQADHLGSLLWPTVGVAVVGLALLAVQERSTPEPILPVALWRDPVIRVCNMGSLVIGAASMAVTVFLPTYVQGVLGGSAFAAGTSLAFMSIGWPVAATLAGRLMLKTSYRTTALLGTSLLVCGSIMLALITPARGIAWGSAAAALIGFGLGLTNSPFMVAVQDAAAWQLRGIATASNAFNRMLGGALGTAILGAVLNGALARRLPGMHEPVQTLVDPARRTLLTAPEIATLSVALAHCLQLAFVAGILIALSGCAAAWALPRGTRPSTSRRERPAASDKAA